MIRPRPDTTEPDVLDAHAKFFRGMGDPARLGLLLRLRSGPSAAGDLARECGLSPSNASNHLQCLLECGLVGVEPRGRRNVYRLADPGIARLLAESERLLSSRMRSLIEGCRNYRASSRRALRSAARAEGGSNPSERRRRRRQSDATCCLAPRSAP